MRKQLSFLLQSKLRQAGLNQDEFADWIGISKSTLSAYLSGTGNPRLDTLLLIAEKLDFGIGFVPKQNLHPIAAMIDLNYQALLMEISNQLMNIEQNSNQK